jgi:hypothetical protein
MRLPSLCAILSLTVSVPVLAHAAAPNSAETAVQSTLGAMKKELQRAMSKLRLKSYEAPYFIAYAVRDYDERQVTARLGAVVARERDHGRQAHVEVRVGSYQQDNTSSQHEVFDLSDPES